MEIGFGKVVLILTIAAFPLAVIFFLAYLILRPINQKLNRALGMLEEIQRTSGT